MRLATGSPLPSPCIASAGLRRSLPLSPGSAPTKPPSSQGPPWSLTVEGWPLVHRAPDVAPHVEEQEMIRDEERHYRAPDVRPPGWTGPDCAGNSLLDRQRP